jgi:hypothetical protein
MLADCVILIIHCCGISPFSVHFVKREKKSNESNRCTRTNAAVRIFFRSVKLGLFTAQQQKQVRPSGRGTNDSRGETRRKC